MDFVAMDTWVLDADGKLIECKMTFMSVGQAMVHLYGLISVIIYTWEICRRVIGLGGTRSS